jgi:fumarylacetoacetase
MIPSWQNIPSESDFTLANIPFGIFSLVTDPRRRCGTIVGTTVIDLSILADAGWFDNDIPEARYFFQQSTLNVFLEQPKIIWVKTRKVIIDLLEAVLKNQQNITSDLEHERISLMLMSAIHPMEHVQMHLPVTIRDYTDFYSSRNHAENVGTMFRGKEKALQPNWLHLPVGYHGRSSTVVVSGQEIRRPCGQLTKNNANEMEGSYFGPSVKLDFELEVAFFVGGPSNEVGTPLSVDDAHDRIFGFVLMNDWSARDIQKWEYVPLGPFTSKNFGTTISPWIVTTMALEPFQATSTITSSSNCPDPLPYLQDKYRKTIYDVHLSVAIQGKGMTEPAIVSEVNMSDLYWTAAQQLAHHSVTGCVMRAGDLLGSGTISSKEKGGSMLELSWNGTKDVLLGDTEHTRRFLEDGDTVILQGWASKEGTSRVGFGSCTGTIIPIQTASRKIPSSIQDEKPRYTQLKLYHYGYSSASWRVRIALEAKSIPYESILIQLTTREQFGEEFSKQINPMKQVPVLEVKDRGQIVRFSQSMAILEFLEEVYSDLSVKLLPSDPTLRGRARHICEVVNSGIQPLQSVSFLRDLQDRSDNRIVATDEARRHIHKGLQALEDFVGDHGLALNGGIRPSMADVVLVPQLFNAKFTYEMDLESEFPRLAKILYECLRHPWFSKTHPSNYQQT